MKLRSAIETHIGRRSNNEDNACNEPKLGLYAVADGMGGYEGGEVASEIAIDTLRSFVSHNRSDRDCTWPYKLDMQRSLEENLLLTGTRLAHETIGLRRKGKLSEMGSTLVAMLTCGAEATVVHVGDSRVYQLRGGVLAQITRDHSLYEELLACGTELPAKEDFAHGNVITRALGLRGQADATSLTMQVHDRYILCSDGLSDVVRDEDILELSLAILDPEELTRELVSRAYESGGKDNITVVVVDVLPSASRAS
jgi:serine/threonine protein phosphatase PrpC